MGQAYRPYNNENNDRSAGHSFVDRAQQQQRMEEAESLDMNAGIHGNWTIENAKAKLHQFLQMNKITADYKYSPVGPDHSRYAIFDLLIDFFFLLCVLSVLCARACSGLLVCRFN